MKKEEYVCEVPNTLEEPISRIDRGNVFSQQMKNLNYSPEYLAAIIDVPESTIWDLLKGYKPNDKLQKKLIELGF